MQANYLFQVVSSYLLLPLNCILPPHLSSAVVCGTRVCRALTLVLVIRTYYFVCQLPARGITEDGSETIKHGDNCLQPRAQTMMLSTKFRGSFVKIFLRHLSTRIFTTKKGGPKWSKINYQWPSLHIEKITAKFR